MKERSKKLIKGGKKAQGGGGWVGGWVCVCVGSRRVCVCVCVYVCKLKEGGCVWVCV